MMRAVQALKGRAGIAALIALAVIVACLPLAATLLRAPLADAPAIDTSTAVAGQRSAAARPPTSTPTPDTNTDPAAIIASATADGPFGVKTILKIDHPLKHGDYVWNEDGVPPGPIVITTDLAAQTMSVFRGGNEIGAAVVLYGEGVNESPLGTFKITQKDEKHVSNIYNAPMPYMLRLTNDGISIHGSDVRLGYATHGCIGVPLAFAKKLFEQVKIGDRVIITNGKMLVKPSDRIAAR